jgi:hypothetical protein
VTAWTGWSLRILAVLLPAVFMAHGVAVVWLYEYSDDTHVLLGMIIMIVLLLLGLALLPLGLIGAGLWMVDTEDDDEGRVLFSLMLVALLGLAAGYFGTLEGFELWVLQWRGAETTCTVSYVSQIGGSSPEGPSPLIFNVHGLECAAADAPGSMRTMRTHFEPGERVSVVYDPGATPASTRRAMWTTPAPGPGKRASPWRCGPC